MLGLPKTPFPVTFRELWLPPSINGLVLPASVEGGHPLTLTGAKLGSTVDGVHFNGAVTSNINCGAIHDNVATFWLKFRFKFDQNYAAGAGDMYIWGKHVDATHFVWLVFKTADGKLYFEGDDALGNNFSIAAQDGAADITTWEAGRWYTVLASISAANDVRFIIDDGTVVTVVTPIALPNGGDFIIGDYEDPGAGTGFEGVIADFVCGIDDLSQAAPDEEYNLYAGAPPADTVNEYLLDEGRGVTAYDRGSGGNNGTLDTSAKWSFGQVEQPVLGLDGINDFGLSSAGVDIAGDLTIVWVGKMKSTYDAVTGQFGCRLFLTVDANNRIYLDYDAPAPNTLRFVVIGNGTTSIPIHSIKPVIDDYWIDIATLTIAGVANWFLNGTFVVSATGAGPMSGAPCQATLGRHAAGVSYDVSKPLMVALVDGAFTAKQTRAFTRWLKDIYNLPISV